MFSHGAALLPELTEAVPLAGPSSIAFRRWGRIVTGLWTVWGLRVRAACVKKGSNCVQSTSFSNMAGWSNECLATVLSRQGVRREILDCIYLYEGDLQHLSMTSATIQSQCSANELKHIRARRICHLDLTLPVVDVSACPWNADVLEVTISPGLAGRSDVLRDFLPRCTCLRHIHLRLMPDPGWHLVQWAQGAPEAVVEAERHERISGNDSDALVLAKLSRCRARASPLHHFNQSLKAILESLKDNFWCPNLSGTASRSFGFSLQIPVACYI